LGHVANRDNIYSGFDLVAVPSINDPFPTVALEAGAYGLPVIGARSGGLPEIVRHGQTGLLVQPGSAAEFAGAISRLANDPALRTSLGLKAADHIATQFNVSVMAQRFLAAMQIGTFPDT
jgi:glycosyltransferase involved in cell wall biosynthesis